MSLSCATPAPGLGSGGSGSGDLLLAACTGTLIPPTLDASAAAARLHAALQATLAGTEALAARHPPVENVRRLMSRVRGELRFLASCSLAPPEAATPCQRDAPDAADVAPASTAGSGGAQQAAARQLTPVRIQGLVNNLRGYTGELLAAQVAPGLVALGKRFHVVACAAPPAPGASHEPAAQMRAKALRNARTQHRARSAAADGPPPGSPPPASIPSVDGGARPQGSGAPHLTLCAEVDLVCQGGSAWMEIKNQERFGLDSEHWHTAKDNAKGLKRQVSELLAVAAAPCNQVRWAAPAVVVLFPSGADADVTQALQDMGVTVLTRLDDLPAMLPPAPPEPVTTNLDTTTMCALVSEVSWAERGDERVARWASRTPQWRQCVAEEAQEPIRQVLARFLAPGRPLMASDVAVNQFQTLMEMHGGPREQARWRGLMERLEVVPATGANISDRMLGLGNLREVGAQQLGVFGVGDARRAVTLTANGAAVRSAAHQGVHLEAFIHRPVWLAGL